jgi:plastocyanin
VKRASVIVVAALVLCAGYAFRRTRAAAAGHRHAVAIENMEFSPRSLTIRLGEQVVFTNRDLVTHTATARAGSGTSEAFDSGPIPSGGSWTFAPRLAGTLRYACTFHPVMHGTLEVVSP